MEIKKISRLAMLLAISVILNIVESFFPIFTGIVPGLKIGLANIIIVATLYLYGSKEAFYVSILRIIVVGFLRTGLFSSTFLFSISGAIFSLIIMILLKKINLIIIMRNLTTPINDEDLKNLRVGDHITISGTMYTGRDAALPQLVELIKKDEVPIDLNGTAIMHTAFSEAGIAPTTSNKEEIESAIPALSKAGVKVHIGKGMLSNNTILSLKENNSIFVITPPVAALLTNKVLEKKCVLFEHEGMEAMFELKVKKIPGIVAVRDGKSI